MIEEFMRRTVDLRYRPKAVFPSEMYLFYLVARSFNVDCIIESGIGMGGSTQYLTRLFPDVPITSIDKDVAGAVGLDVKLVSGDALEKLPEIMAASPALRIGVLIDGPKGEPAVALARKLLEDPRVPFVAVHDLAFEGCDYRIHSHDPVFRERFGFLDLNVGEALVKHPRGPGLSFFTC